MSLRSSAIVVTVSIMLAAAVPGANALGQSAQFDSGVLFRIVAGFYNLDPDLLEAIAVVESAGDSLAVSSAGAAGLMQLMPETARQFGISNRFDPVQNVIGAARFLDYLARRQRSRADGVSPVPEILAAYNAGPDAVEKYGGVPPYRDTRQYVARVLLAYILQGLIIRGRLRVGLKPAAHNDASAGPGVGPLFRNRVKRSAAQHEDRALVHKVDEIRLRRQLLLNTAAGSTARIPVP